MMLRSSCLPAFRTCLYGDVKGWIFPLTFWHGVNFLPLLRKRLNQRRLLLTFVIIYWNLSYLAIIYCKEVFFYNEDSKELRFILTASKVLFVAFILVPFRVMRTFCIYKISFYCYSIWTVCTFAFVLFKQSNFRGADQTKNLLRVNLVKITSYV